MSHCETNEVNLRYLLILSLVFLTSCGFTAEEIAAARKAAAEQLRLEDETACTSYGFSKGTSAFSRCMQQEAHNRKQLRAARAAEAAAIDAANTARRSAQRTSEATQIDTWEQRNCRLYGGGWCL